MTMAQILNGKEVSDRVLSELSEKLQKISASSTLLPKLVVILVGDDAASQVYVNKKAKTAKSIGMASEVLVFPANTPQTTLLAEIQRLNKDSSVHGILIQLPLPKHLNSLEVLSAIDPAKDVDGLHPYSMGRLLVGDLQNTNLPCTPSGIMTLLKAYNVPLAGKHAVVLGRSNIVGKPIGLLLLQENATVTYCHSKTPNLESWISQADIVVAAVGIPKMVKGSSLKPGVVVIDVGINRLDGKLVGDVDYESALENASYITPVPGGVGPMTIATLMQNTLSCYQKSQASAPRS